MQTPQGALNIFGWFWRDEIDEDKKAKLVDSISNILHLEGSLTKDRLLKWEEMNEQCPDLEPCTILMDGLSYCMGCCKIGGCECEKKE